MSNYSMLTLDERKQLAEQERKSVESDKTDVPYTVAFLRHVVFDIAEANEENGNTISKVIDCLKLKSSYGKVKNLTDSEKQFAIRFLKQRPHHPQFSRAVQILRTAK